MLDAIRTHSPRILIALPREVNQVNSAVSAHVCHTADYLRHLAGLVLYCDFDLSPADARQLANLLGDKGLIFVSPSCAVAQGITFARVSLAELKEAYSLLALWLFRI